MSQTQSEAIAEGLFDKTVTQIGHRLTKMNASGTKIQSSSITETDHGGGVFSIGINTVPTLDMSSTTQGFLQLPPKEMLLHLAYLM
jgi:hypothetical protein